MTHEIRVDSAFWNLEAAQLSARLQTSAESGLSSKEAARRFREYGPNEIEETRRHSRLRLLSRQFSSPLVLILVFGAAISFALRGWVDGIIILTIVLGSTLLGFIQEWRASTAIEQLRGRLSLKCRVVRDGVERIVQARRLVPGDIVLLSAGNLVPGDGLLTEARDFLVIEASLSGESFPVEKRPGIVPATSPLAARTNSVFAGASVRSGTATLIVVDTGKRTVLGRIASSLLGDAPETAFNRGIRQFGHLLVRVMIVVVLFVVLVNQLLDRPVLESLLFAVALAVALSPELLPAIVSVTLSAGARHMASRGVIVRHLEAIENLGGMDVLCVDKTGTLTQGVIRLSDAVDPAGESSAAVKQLVFLNASLETGIKNPLDAAIVDASANLCSHGAEFTKVDEIPYDFQRRRLTIVVAPRDCPQRHLMITKGACVNILDICDSMKRGDALVSLDHEARHRLEAYYEQKGKEGFRVLALATCEFAAKARYERDDEVRLVFAGFLLFLDPPRPDAPKTVKDLARLGVSIKVISGDNRFVTAHLAETIGLDAKSMITGEELSQLLDEALWSIAPRTSLFVEIDPQQKERIVRALQHSGHTVGYLGDGINDAPALHAADIGISVDHAVDVARESADIVLLRSDLDVVRQGVEDGRRTFANTLKYIHITTSANFGNMVSMAVAAPLLPFLPLTAKQILLNNFLSDLPSVAIAADSVDQESVAQAPRWDIRNIRHFMIAFGLVSSSFDLLTFWLLLNVFDADQATFQTAWFVVSLLTELFVVFVLRTRRAAWRSTPGRLLLWSTLAVCAAALVLPYTGPLAAALGFRALPAVVLASALGIVSAYLVATEVTKLLYYSRRRAEPATRGA
jgi:P-type Mg2+ transporter